MGKTEIQHRFLAHRGQKLIECHTLISMEAFAEYSVVITVAN